MPDFNTRTPEEAGQDGAVTRGRVASIANKVRTLLVANKLRAVLVMGGVVLVVAAAVPLWLLTHSSTEASDQPADWPYSVACDPGHLKKTGECVAPTAGSMVCKARSMAAVNRQTRCVTGVVGPYMVDKNSVTCEGSTWTEEAECVPPGSSPDGIVRCRAPTREAVTRTERCRDEEWIKPYLGGG